VRKLLNVHFLIFRFLFVCHYVVPSLSEDPTPLAESFNPLHFELDADGKREAANKLDLPTAASGGSSGAVVADSLGGILLHTFHP